MLRRKPDGHNRTKYRFYADVQATRPATLRFYVVPPDNWDDISKQRLNAHFESYNLGARFAVQSSEELAVVKSMLLEHHQSSNSQIISEHLGARSREYQKININSWQAAMYKALAENNWYCEEGFRL